MGNSLGGKKTAKVMKINGETFKLKTPIEANEVVREYPGHVLLESESVKHFGTRAKPLESHQELLPKRLYFVVELPKMKKEQVPRRVRSGINMSAKDRLESLMLARRSVSDLSIMKPTSYIFPEETTKGESANGGVRVRMRLPRAEVEKLMKESKDEEEAAEKIMELCLMNNNNNNNSNNNNNNGGKLIAEKDDKGSGLNQQMHWNKVGHGRVREGIKNRAEKRVSFCPVNEGEIQIAVS